MSHETPFRIAVLMVFVLTMTVVGYHRWQARSGERLERREEGLLLAIVLRLAGLVLWSGVLTYLIHPASMAWASVALPDGLRWSGAVIGVFSIGLMVWTLSNLGKNLTDTVVRRANATLVTTGPYRWVRHPFYVTTGCLMVAATLLSANWLIGLGGLVVLALLALRTPKEEQKLLEGFGGAYRDYRAATGRFFPKLGGKRRGR